MQYTSYYHSPLGNILLSADDLGLTGLWFEGQKYYAAGLNEHQEQPSSVLESAMLWLDIYFAGQEPDFSVPLHVTGTPLQMKVWSLLQEIPYGQTTTYGALAKTLGIRSAQAIGRAVGRNPICVILPCHRVVGANGSLTGYAAGMEKKAALLALEKGGSIFP